MTPRPTMKIMMMMIMIIIIIIIIIIKCVIQLHDGQIAIKNIHIHVSFEYMSNNHFMKMVKEQNSQEI